MSRLTNVEKRRRAIDRLAQRSRESGYVVLAPNGRLAAQVQIFHPADGAGRLEILARFWPHYGSPAVHHASANGCGYAKDYAAESALPWGEILTLEDPARFAREIESRGARAVLQDLGYVCHFSNVV